MDGMKRFRGLCATIAAMAAFVVTSLVCEHALAQPVPSGVCRPVSERASEVGCWVLADEPIGELAQAKVFWHLTTYATRAEAETAKSAHGIVVESFGKIWLFTI